MNSEQQPPPNIPRPGGKAAERLREQLAKQYGDSPPQSALDEVERLAEEEREKNSAAGTNSPED